MEARTATGTTADPRRLPAWLLGLIPLLLIAGAVGAFALFDGPGLTKRSGPPVEKLVVERTVLKPGEIKLSVRNDGPDAITLAQVIVNDGYTDFSASARELGRLDTSDVSIRSKGMRRLVTLYAVVSFFFNTMVLAMTINLAASMA